MTRTISQIEHDLVATQRKIDAGHVKGSKTLTPTSQMRLLKARAEALREELDRAERARQALVAMGSKEA